MHSAGSRPSSPEAVAPARRAGVLPNRLRRLLLACGFGAALGPGARAARADATRDTGLRARDLVFPRDFGSHPQLQTEWWYITGHCTVGAAAQARVFGFQLTFFRARVEGTQAMESRFAAKQLLFAHAALTDLQGQRFWHDQRIARAGFGVASASESDTALRLRDWSLARTGEGYRARIPARDFALELELRTTQPVLLQGDRGLSRKGPEAAQASFYYSQPQLAFDGAITLQGRRFAVAGDGAAGANADLRPGQGAAWLDHEWSDGLMPPDAVGWDWLGMNLFDGSALTAFQMRNRQGKALWDGGSFRHPRLDDGVKPYVFARGEVLFQAVRGWKSPLTGASYPVEWLLRTPAEHYVVRALLDNQELDSRGSTGAVYWEGLCDLLDSGRRPVGRGYLEMTGYAKPLVL